MNQQLQACSNFMSLNISNYFKWNAFACILNTDQMPVIKENCKKADLYICIGETSKDLLVGSRFLDRVALIIHSSNKVEMREINPIYVTEGHELQCEIYSNKESFCTQAYNTNTSCVVA